MTTKEEFLRLLEKDNEFRLAVAGFLGYGEILKRLEKHDRKFVMILKRLREHDKKFTEVLTRLEEHDRKFTEVLTRLEEHDKKFAEILNEIKQLREDFKRLSMRVEVTIGSMGRRWGEDLERMVLEIFKEALEKRGIEPGKVEKMRFVDEDGKITGIRGRIIDIRFYKG
jgi:DNA repair exonuclease SbcCD ATPase subunit